MRRPGTLLALLALFACRENSPPAPAAQGEDLPPGIAVSALRKDLVFTYTDPATSKLASTSSLAAIPEPARGQVVVTDLTLTPEQRRADRYLYLADLRTARPDGSYPVAVVSRYAFRPAGTAAEAGTEGHGVVLYTASWCGVCKRVKALLSSLGVPFTEKDIEGSKSAAEELAAKARSAGFQPSGVPVIDVAGTILQGLDERTLKSVLTEKGFLH